MAFPTSLQVDLFIDGQWVDAVTTGDGVRTDAGVTIRRGRSNWSAQVDPSKATFKLANDDGRWSPDNTGSPYHGSYRRNIPCRVGVGTGSAHLEVSGSDAASTPDIPGAGGGAPTAPTFTSVTQDAETAFTTSHTFDLPATLAAGDRLLAVASAGHTSLTPTDQGGGVTDLDDWTLVTEGQLYDPWHRYQVWERGPLTAAEATALAGDTIQFTTTLAVKSSCQVIRTAGARAGGLGTAYAFSVDAASSYTSAPNPPAVTAPWGADEHRWYAFAIYGSAGQSVSAYPSSYTSIADGNVSAAVQIASAHRTTAVATEDPGAYTLTGNENAIGLTFVYRAEEDTSANGALDITGDIDLRISGQLFRDLVDIVSGGRRARLAHKNSGGNGWEWEIYNALGNFVSNFTWWSSTGVRNETSEATGSVIPLSFMHELFALRVTLDVDNGASGHDVAYWTSDSVGGTWTQVGSTITRSGTTDITANDAPVRVGANPADITQDPFPGRIDEFEMLDGINGTKVADIDFTAQTVGATAFTGTDGLPWSLGTGARITDIDWRFHGELASLPVRSNIDVSDVWASVEAQGLFRRLRQGKRRLNSAIRRAITRSATDVVQYWPMEEEGDTVTAFGAAIGSAPMVVTNGYPNAAASGMFVASANIPTPGDSVWTAQVDAYAGVGEWQLRWLQSIPAGTTGQDVAYLVVKTTDIEWWIRWRDNVGGQLQILGYRSGTQIYDSAWTSFNATGKDWRMTFSVQQNGSNVNLVLDAQDPLTGLVGGIYDTNAVGGSAGTVTELKWNRDSNADDFAIGHVVLHSRLTPLSQLADEIEAHDGERAGDRIIRLCLEEGLAYRIEGDPADTERMGAQRPGRLIDLLQECADTDLGILSEARRTVAIHYRTRTSMVDQATVLDVDATDSELADSVELDRDDQGFANDVQVENWNGVTARAVLDDGSPLSISEPPDGAGTYDDTFSVNGQNDRLQALADSRLAFSTVDEPRVSNVRVAMESPGVELNAALRAALFGMSLGDRMTITNYPATIKPTIDQLVQGYTERIETHRHYFDFFSTPAAPWLTGGITDPPEAHQVTYRTQQDLAVPGSPDHVLTALGYTDSAKITRAQLDGILDDWVASTGGTTRTVTSAATWATAMAAAVPGDLIRVTTGFDPGGNLQARGSKYGISGSNMTASPLGGQPGLPIILTCADGVYVDDNNTSSNTAILDIANTSHVWAVGFNVRDGQFGIRCQNLDGSDGFPAYIAYCNVENIGHAGIASQGWFQLITSSGGTPPAGSGNEHGYSQWIVIESNTIDGTGVIDAQFGEGIYIGKGSPGYVGYSKNAWVRGNTVTDWTSDGIDIKPGCSRVFVTDNDIYIGHAVLGSPLSLLYIGDAGGPDRPAWYDFDPEIWCEGNRISDNDITNTDASSAEWMVTVGLSGVRCGFNDIWAWPSGSAAFIARMAIGANDTEAQTFYRADPTSIINNTCWGPTAFDPAGYGSPLTAWPSAVLNNFDVRNNIVDNATPATGEVDADASDFIAAVPAVATAGDAQWLTYGRGSAFDLDPGSALTGTGADISDVDLFVDADISGRAINKAAPNPGAFQPHPANL